MAGPQVFLLDSFPAGPFGGNVAGVVLLERAAPRAWLQGVARELGAPTTGFVDMPSARTGTAQVRFFTPVQEINACGHVTVAIATVLVELGVWSPGVAAVEAAGGLYELAVERDEHGPWVEMRQELRHLERLETVPGLDLVLGAGAPSPAFPLLLAGTGLRHLLVPVSAVERLAELPLVAADIAAVSALLGVDTIGVWATTEQDESAVGVRMRDLCAGIGAVEEPASGTTAATLAFALADAGVLTPARARLEVAMGVEMGRASRLSVLLDFVEDQASLARLQGRSVRVLAGHLDNGPP
jgi:trans-2,3-dihydro-3-hydroxyanthranilate isomerase